MNVQIVITTENKMLNRITECRRLRLAYRQAGETKVDNSMNLWLIKKTHHYLFSVYHL